MVTIVPKIPFAIEHQRLTTVLVTKDTAAMDGIALTSMNVLMDLMNVMMKLPVPIPWVHTNVPVMMDSSAMVSSVLTPMNVWKILKP